MKFSSLIITTIILVSNFKADSFANPLQKDDAYRVMAADINNAVTDFTFKSQIGDDWKFPRQLDRKETVLILIGKVSNKADSLRISSVLASSAATSKIDAFDVVLVLPNGTAFPAPAKDKPETTAPFTTVIDTSNLRQKLLGESDAPYAVALVDQAGFLRRLEAIPAGPAALEMLTGTLKHLHVPEPAMAVGQPAPDFTVRAVSLAQPKGFPLRLSDYRGQKSVLLTFFPRCFTGQCTFQLSSLRDQRAAFEERDIQVVAVSVDPAEGEKGQLAFAQAHQFLYPFVPDTGRNLCLLYGSTRSTEQMATRMSVFIDKAGIVRWIDKQISPSTHGADVIARIDAESASSDHLTANGTGSQ